MFDNIKGDELAAHAYAVEDVLRGGMIGRITQTAGEKQSKSYEALNTHMMRKLL